MGTDRKNWCKGWGVFKYSIEENVGHRLVVEVDQELADYYRALIPKWLNPTRQKFSAHISVIRKEVLPNLDAWGKYDGQIIEFEYEPYIYEGTVYFWLDVFSETLQNVRKELGLINESPFKKPPIGFEKYFHITIANKKSS